MRALSLVCFTLVCLFLSSCGESPHYSITTSDIEALSGEIQQQIPLRVGFYMGEKCEKINYLYTYSPIYGGVTQMFVDVEVRPMFEQAVRRMFKEVVPVFATETSNDFRTKNLDAILSVGVITCEIYMERPVISSWGHSSRLINAKLTAEWSVTSLDGVVLTSVKPFGEGRAKLGEYFEGHKDVVVAALNAHFDRAHSDIVMTGWWKDPSWRYK